MTFTATPQPSNVPPRVQLDANTDDVGASFTTLAVFRDGKLIREQPYVGGSAALVYDYEAPFGVPVTYTAEGEYLSSGAADWTETWPNLTAWTGGTASYSVAAGKASSSVLNAAITRTVSGTIERVDVVTPSYVRVELLTAADVVVASVQVDSKVTLVGTSSTQATGSGSYTVTLTAGTVTATATDASWSLSRSYVGVPTKVRVVALGVSYPAGLTFTTTNTPLGVHVDSSGNIFVTDYAGLLVRKYNSSGVLQLSFTTTGTPYHIVTDSTGNIYITDYTNSLVRKYNSSGTQTLSFTTTGKPWGIDVDSAGNIFVADYTNSLVRKFNSAGVQQLQFSTTGKPEGLAVDGSGNIFVADYTTAGGTLRKFNSAGVQQLSFASNKANDVSVDSAGNIFVTDQTGKLIRKYNSAGVAQASFSTVGTPYGVALDAAGNVYTTDFLDKWIRKFLTTIPSVGSITARLAAALATFSASVTVTLAVAEAWLIHPSQPSLSCSIQPALSNQADGLVYIEASSGDTKTADALRTIHRPVGRRRPVVVASGPRHADEWTLVLGALTIAAKNTIRAIVDDQTVLLLRSAPALPMDLPDDWYTVGDVTTNRAETPNITERTILTLPLIPVDEPIVRQGALWNYGSTLLVAPTYADRLALFPTYLDALAGQS